MQIKRILACTALDDEEPQVEQAMEMARHFGAEVTLLFASTVREPRKDFTMPDEWERLVQRQLVADRARLEDMRMRLRGQGVEVSHGVIDGVPHRAILRATRQLDADLVAIGTRDGHRLQRLLLGSTAERVLRHSPVHVLLCRPHTGAGYRRVAVAVDFSAASERALALTASLVAPGGIVDVYHCWQFPTERLDVFAASEDGRSVMRRVRPQLHRRALDMGTDLCGRYARDDVEIRFAACEGKPRDVLVERLRAAEYDLVSLGSRGHSALERLLLGSVAEAVARSAPCSALVVR